MQHGCVIAPAEISANFFEAIAGVATSKRDAAIREAYRAGASLRDIAAESEMSHMTVKRILERTGD